MESDLVGYLLSQPAISNLVKRRIYPNAAPQGAEKPLLVYRRMTGGHSMTLSGSAGWAQPEVQLVVVDKPTDQPISPLSFSNIKQIGEALRQAMQGFRGQMCSTVVRAVALMNESDVYAQPQDAGEGVDQLFLTYSILYEESKPVFV